MASWTNFLDHLGNWMPRRRSCRMRTRRMHIDTAAGMAAIKGRKHGSKRAWIGSYIISGKFDMVKALGAYPDTRTLKRAIIRAVN
jgi:hypothetical protein